MFKMLFTGRLLRLAAPLPEDAVTFAGFTVDDEYLRLINTGPARPWPPDSFDFSKPDSPNNCYFHLRTLAEDRVIGFAALSDIQWNNQTADLAIGIGNPKYRGKGYGSDALNVLLNYAFDELNLYRVGLSVIEYNTVAIHVYERLGFVREGVRRAAVQREGQRYDLLLYGILRDEWLARE